MIPKARLGVQNSRVVAIVAGVCGVARRDILSRMVPRIISAIIFAIWLVLVVLGKGGFVHLLLLGSLGVAAVDAVAVYRSRMTIN
jgi:hypothetical protein